MNEIIDSVNRPHGRLELWIYRNGELIEYDPGENLVLKGYQTICSKLIGGASSATWAITQIGFGTNSSAAAFNQTVLTSAFIKDLDAPTYPATNKVAFPFTLDSGEANGKAIREFGLLAANNTLFARRVRSGVLNKTVDISLSGRWIIEFLQ